MAGHPVECDPVSHLLFCDLIECLHLAGSQTFTSTEFTYKIITKASSAHQQMVRQ